MATPIKDHEFRELVNSLRDVAAHYAGTEQLRAQLGIWLRLFIDGQDTTQRAALARVEAELHAVHDMVTMLEEHEWAEHAGKGPISKGLEYCITTMRNELHEANERADTAQAQLAEAVDFLRRLSGAGNYQEMLCLMLDADEFLARLRAALATQPAVPDQYEYWSNALGCWRPAQESIEFLTSRGFKVRAVRGAEHG